MKKDRSLALSPSAPEATGLGLGTLSPGALATLWTSSRDPAHSPVSVMLRSTLNPNPR
jgi:hypothetical protein